MFMWMSSLSAENSTCPASISAKIAFRPSDYDQKDSQGFINLWGLPDKVQALREQGKL